MREIVGGGESGTSEASGPEAVSEVWPFVGWIFEVGVRSEACAVVVETSSAAAKRSLSS